MKVCQGEREMARHNKVLGNFRLEGIPAAPRGVPQIEVTFDIDANGILHVSAKDTGTGREQKIRIEASSGLSKDEVEKMRREAETHVEEDTKFREEAELRNRADAAVHSTEKMLKEAGEKLPASDREAIQKELTALRTALKGGTGPEIQRAMEGLTAAQHEMAQRVYSTKAAGTSPEGEGAGRAPGAPEGGKESDVVDAEFVDVDDKK